MTFIWWTCKVTRQKLTASSKKRAAKQIAEIDRAYKAAKIPGRTPHEWIGKISRMNHLGKPMPKGLEHLASLAIDENTHAFLESAERSAKTYFSAKHSKIRAQTFKKTQKKYTESNLAKESQARGGKASGERRRLARDEFALQIVDAYKTALEVNSNIKPIASKVVDWFVTKHSTTNSKRSLVQILRRAKVAT